MKITHLDTACILIDINGFRILTDPTLDPPGRVYRMGGLIFSKKYSQPPIEPADLGPIDLVLLSHHHHHDNFDYRGRELAKSVPLIVSTPAAEKALHQTNVRGLRAWEKIDIPTDKVPGLRITATPAQHCSWRILNPIAGPVTGFILEWDDQPNGTLYISGDTVLFDGIRQVAQRFKIDTAVLHLGRAGFPYLSGAFVHYTFTAREAIEAAQILQARQVVPIHYKGWWHFREKESDMRAQLSRSAIAERLVWLETGLAQEIG